MAPPSSQRLVIDNKFNGNIIVIGVLFFVFGFVTWLGSVLIPYLKIACELNTFESYFVAFSFYISSLVFRCFL